MNRSFRFIEKHFKEFIENASELILCLDMEGRLLYVNRSWKETLGYSEEEAFAMDFWKTIHPDHLEKCRKYIEHLKNGNDPNPCEKPSETVFITKENKHVWVEVNSGCRIESFDGEAVIICSFKDISSIKKAEEKATYLTALVEQCNDIIAFKNMELKVVAANNAYAKLAGYKSTEDILGKSFYEIFKTSHEESSSRLTCDMDLKAQTLKPGDSISIIHSLNLPELKDKDFLVKKYPIFDSSDKVIGTGEIIMDVTEFEKTQKMLEESKKRSELLINQMMHGFAVHEIICDESGKPIDYKYLSVNKKFEELTGLSAENIIGKTVLEIMPRTEGAWIDKYAEVALRGNPIQFDTYSVHFNKWFQVTAYSPRYGEFAVLLDDITERKELEKALFIEKEQLKKTLLSVVDAVITTDKNGRIKLMNKSAEKLTGWEIKNALGMKIEDVYDVIDDSTKKKLCFLFEKVLLHGYQLNGSGHKLLISKKGRELYIEDTAAPIKDMLGKICGMVLVFRDSTEKTKRFKLVEFMSLHDQMTGLYNRRYMFDSIKRLDTKRNLPFSVVYLDINGLKLTNDSFGHEMGDNLIVSVGNEIKEILRSDDIVGRLGGDEFLVLLPKTDIENAAMIAERISKSVSKIKLESLVPSIALGCAVKTKEEQKIDETLKMAEASMYKDKLKSGKIMRNTMVENLMDLMHDRYTITHNHSKKVMDHCEKIANAMGLSQKETVDLKKTAMLHNIGEIVIPASLLNKPDKLSAEEYELIKIHSEKGYQILKSIDEYAALAESVLEHHERWDGKGYPNGLKEGDILLHSRIINIADSYEAMTSDRTYKKGMTKEEAIAELKKCRGKQFDPEIVDIFIEKVLQH